MVLVFFAFSGHPRGRATEGEFATNAAGGWGEGHAARNRMTPAHPPLRGCKNSVRMDFASDRARYLLLLRTTKITMLSVCTQSSLNSKFIFSDWTIQFSKEDSRRTDCTSLVLGLNTHD
jgi:hypothetical protein